MEIQFEDYDRISDCLMYLSDNITLNFVVSLSKKDRSGGRRFFQYETVYGVDKYTNHPTRSIKRNMTFYYVFDMKNSFGNGILLRPADVEALLMFITKNVLPWFYGNKKELAFKLVNDELVLNEYNPATWAQNNDRYIVFEPSLFTYENGKTVQSLLLTFYNGETANLTVDKFMGLINILKSDMYAIACSNAVYAKMEPHGINVYNNQGLGGGPKKEQEINKNWHNGSANKASNSFLDNAKSKKEGQNK